MQNEHEANRSDIIGYRIIYRDIYMHLFLYPGKKSIKLKISKSLKYCVVYIFIP